MRWAAVAVRARAELRRSWRGTLAAGLLVGIAAGGVGAAAAAARRTAGAYDDLVAASNGIDLALYPACTNPDRSACERPDAQRSVELADALRRHPAVEDLALVAEDIMPVTDSAGHLLQPEDDGCFSGSGGVSVVASADGRLGSTMQRQRIVQGRAVDPNRANEVVLSAQTARDHGVRLGDRILVYGESEDCGDPDAWGEPWELTVVGLTVLPGEVRPSSGRYLQGVYVSAALAETIVGDGGGVESAVVLAPGATVADLETDDVPAFDVAINYDDFEADVERGLRQDAGALWLVALLGGLAGVFVVTPALLRYALANAGDEPTLRAMGWTRRERDATGLLSALVIGIVAAVVVVSFVALSSASTPIGDGRLIEPRSRIAFDAPVMLIACVVALVIALAAVVGAGRLAEMRRDRDPGRTTLVGRFLATVPTRPTLDLGIRFGLESTRRGVALLAMISGAAIGVATVSGVLVYTASAERLRTSPEYAGWRWDHAIYFEFAAEGDAGDAAGVVDELSAWPEVERAGSMAVFLPPLQLGESGVPSSTIAFSVEPGAIRLDAMEGRAPAAADEILLHPILADELGVSVGDIINATFSGDGGQPFEVVGIGPVPVIGAEFDRGSAITFDALARVEPELAADLAPDHLLIDRRTGSSAATLAGRLQEVGVEPGDAALGYDVLEAVGIDSTRTKSAPQLLAFLMLVTGTAVLAFGIVGRIRARTNDLAVLRALGFSRGQTRATAAYAGVAVVVTAFVIGLPLGIVIGRLAWTAYAGGIGVFARPRVPVPELLAFTAAALAVGTVLALAAVRRGLRRSVGEALRAE